MTVRILFIDDDRAGREVALFNLRKAGHEVTSASDGQEGLSLFSSGAFDIVITDVKMPGISGIEVLRRIRSLEPAVPLLVVTAFGDMGMAVEAMREGACYFLAKPFDREHLLLAVDEILGRRCLAEAAEDLRVPSEVVERGIVCVFPQGGGSVRLRGGDAAEERDSSPEGHDGGGRHEERRESGGN